MKILSHWLRDFVSLPLTLTDQQLAEDLTLRGIAVEGVHPLPSAPSGEGNGHLFEMDITTNRVDAMNHYGIAREAATIYNLPLAPLLSSSAETLPAPSFPVCIDPSAASLCGRFTARILREVTISPSSGRVAHYFELLGQKQIWNAVDASNFVLQAMGHPTHAFDLDKITGGIQVRLAHPGERLKLLDGTERTLAADDLVIADDVKALSLAGVMGGWDSMITPQTRNILVESAWFDPASIRRSARRHGLHTDASHRFERGADFNAAPVANHLVTALILASGGRTEGGLIDLIQPAAQSLTAARPPVTLSVAQVQRHLGCTLADGHPPDGASALTSALIHQYLTALGCTLVPAADGSAFAVTLPSWRLDLTREIDLIEEIARVFGYNRFANTLPTPGMVLAHPQAAAEHAVRTRLLALGFSEAVSSSFASPADAALFYTASAAAPGTIELENPLSEEASLLRPTLLPGMLTMLSHNLNRDVSTVRLFEQGHTFTGSPAEVQESPSLALGLSTSSPAATPLHASADNPFFELKGAIESLASLFDLPAALTWTTDSLPAWLHPARSATALLQGAPLARFGELSPAETSRRKLRQPVFLAEIDLARLYALPLRRASARELSRFQAVQRDFSFTFPDATPWATISAAVHRLGIAELQRLSPVEIFRDSPASSKPGAIPPGHHALLLRAVFQSPDRTLREEDLTSASAAIISTLTRLGGSLRA